MKKVKMRCVVCHKEFETSQRNTKWFGRKVTVIGKTMCSARCRKRFKLLIYLNDVLDELEKIK